MESRAESNFQHKVEELLKQREDQRYDLRSKLNQEPLTDQQASQVLEMISDSKNEILRSKINSFFIHESVLPQLLELLSSKDEDLQVVALKALAQVTIRLNKTITNLVPLLIKLDDIFKNTQSKDIRREVLNLWQILIYYHQGDFILNEFPLTNLDQQLFAQLLLTSLAKGEKSINAILNNSQCQQRLYHSIMNQQQDMIDIASTILQSEVVLSFSCFQSISVQLVLSMKQNNEVFKNLLLILICRFSSQISYLIDQSNSLDLLISQSSYEGSNGATLQVVNLNLLKYYLISTSTTILGDNFIDTLHRLITQLLNSSQDLQAIGAQVFKHSIPKIKQSTLESTKFESIVHKLISNISSSNKAEVLIEACDAIKVYISSISKSKFEEILGLGIQSQLVNNLVVNNRVWDIVACLSLMNTILQQNLKFTQSKMKNNEFLQESKAIDILETLQQHDSERIYKLAYSIISENLEFSE